MKKTSIILLLCFCSFVGYGQSTTTEYESDTTIIGTREWYGKSTKIRYYFRKENYSKAFEFVTLRTIPFMQLNDRSQDRLIELHPYILKEEEIKSQKHKP